MPPRNAPKKTSPGSSDISSRYMTARDRTSVYTFPMNGSDGAKYPANQLTKKTLQPGDQGRHVLGSKGR